MNLTRHEILPFGILDVLEVLRRPGERLWPDTARRVAFNEAIGRAHGSQREAARILGISPRVVNYYAADLQLRPKDRRAS